MKANVKDASLGAPQVIQGETFVQVQSASSINKLSHRGGLRATPASFCKDKGAIAARHTLVQRTSVDGAGSRLIIFKYFSVEVTP